MTAIPEHMTAHADTKANEAKGIWEAEKNRADKQREKAQDARLRYIYHALQAGWTWGRIGGKADRKFWDRNRQRADRIVHGKPG